MQSAFTLASQVSYSIEMSINFVGFWTLQEVFILDPSDKFRPEKSQELFRTYTNDNAYYQRVRNTYHQMHSVQTLDYAKQKVSVVWL